VIIPVVMTLPRFIAPPSGPGTPCPGRDARGGGHATQGLTTTALTATVTAQRGGGCPGVEPALRTCA
jgi:hypothetical protein